VLTQGAGQTGRVSEWVPFSADGFSARWITALGDEVGLALRWDNEAWTATVHLSREATDVVYRLSPMWQIRQVMVFRDLDQPDLWLGTDGHGRWGEVNGVHRPELSGAHDIGVAGSPFHHTVAIRRSELLEGSTAPHPTLTIDVETLGVVAADATYTRLGPRRWRVAHGDDPIEFDVDEHGLPLDVGDRFRRVG
jgi:hypothetical protein